MLIKVETWVYIEVDDIEQGEEACSQLNSGLESQLRGFPVGEVVDVNVEQFKQVSDSEAEQRGLTE